MSTGVIQEGTLVRLRSGTEGWIQAQVVEYTDLMTFPAPGGAIYTGPAYKVHILEGKHKGETIRVPANYVELPQGKSVVGRFSVQEVIDSIQKAIDEADKTASVKRIERALGGIDPKILEAEVITDLEYLRTAIADYHGITRAGLTPEEYQGEKETAFEAIQEAVDGLDIDEEALKDLEAPSSKPRREQILEFEMTHSLDEVRRMAREKDLSPSGTKREIIARLIKKSADTP